MEWAILFRPLHLVSWCSCIFWCSTELDRLLLGASSTKLPTVAAGVNPRAPRFSRKSERVRTMIDVWYMFIPYGDPYGERISFGMPWNAIRLSDDVPAVAWLPLREPRIFENEVPMQQKCNKYPDISSITPSNFKRPKNSKPSGIRDQEILSFFHVWLEWFAETYTNCTGQVGAAAQAGGGPVYAVASLRRRDIQ